MKAPDRKIPVKGMLLQKYDGYIEVTGIKRVAYMRRY